MNFKKVILYVLVLLFLCSVSFLAGTKIYNNKQDTENRRFFLAHIYFELDRTIYLLSSVEDWGHSIEGTDASINPYRQLLAHLDSMILMSEQGRFYLRNEQNISCLKDFVDSLTIVKHAIGSGISLNNQPICDNFLNDGILSEPEISFLVSFRQDLDTIKNGLYSEQTGQEDKNLSIQDLRDILKHFTDKYRIVNLHNIGLKN